MLSFDKLMNLKKKGTPVDCKHNMLIVDEAHNIRNMKKPKEHNRQMYRPFSKKYEALLECAKKAKKRLLLTATPIINNIGDLYALINIIYGKNLVGSSDDVKTQQAQIALTKTLSQQNIDTVYNLLKGRIDYFTDVATSNFPLTKRHYVEVGMPSEYKKKYDQYIKKHERDMEYYFDHPEAFYNAQRRLVNKVSNEYFSKKLETMLPKIQQGKTLIYTNWLDFGVKPIEKTLKKHNITYGVFTGSLSKESREMLVNDFNDDKLDTLILTAAGSEGLDLKGTKNVIVLDPPWHPAGLNQIIGRAVRFRSHDHLPKHERNVQIYLMVMMEKSGMKWNDKDTKSGDALLYQIIHRKTHLTQEINKLLERINRSTVPNRRYGSESNPKTPEVLVYGRETCYYTREANKFLDNKNILYRFYDMEKNPSLHQELQNYIDNTNLSKQQKDKLGMENNQYNYVPAIIYKGKFIGGFGEIQEILK